MKKTSLFALLLLCAAWTASAQKNAPKDSAAYNARYKAAVYKMFEASGTKSTMDLAVEQLFNTVEGQSPEVRQAMLAELQQAMGIFLDKLIEGMVPIYRKHISLEDMEYFSAIYDTPQGKRLIEAMPAITKETMQLSMQESMSMQSGILEIMQKYKPEQPQPEQP